MAKSSVGAEMIQFDQIEELFYGRNTQHFEDFWAYSSQAEQVLLAKLVRQQVNWQALSPAEESARRQLSERGLLAEENRPFSPLFANWLSLQLPQLEAEAQQGKRPNRSQLLWFLNESFNDEELQDLCFELGVEYDDLPGVGRRNKARELVEWAERYGRLSQLIDLVMEKRPNLSF